MTAPVYLYAGPFADAARHLLQHSALASVTSVEEMWYAGADATKVTLDTPRPSDGEAALWSAMRWFAVEGGQVRLYRAAGLLDDDNRAALATAFAIALGVPTRAEVAS